MASHHHGHDSSSTPYHENHEDMDMGGGITTSTYTNLGSTSSSDLDIEDGEQNSFCSGSGFVTNNGFTVGFGETSCIRLLFTNWNLDSRVQYALGVLAVFTMAFMFELLRFARDGLGGPKDKVPVESIRRDMMTGAVHAVHTGIGYLLMLVAMTYDEIIFTMLIAGFFVGNLTAKRLMRKRREKHISGSKSRPRKAKAMAITDTETVVTAVRSLQATSSTGSARSLLGLCSMDSEGMEKTDDMGRWVN